MTRYRVKKNQSADLLIHVCICVSNVIESIILYTLHHYIIFILIYYIYWNFRVYCFQSSEFQQQYNTKYSTQSMQFDMQYKVPILVRGELNIISWLNWYGCKNKLKLIHSIPQLPIKHCLWSEMEIRNNQAECIYHDFIGINVV